MPTMFDSTTRISVLEASMPLPVSRTVVPSTENVWMPNQFSSQASDSTRVLRRCLPVKIRLNGAAVCSTVAVAAASATASSFSPLAAQGADPVLRLELRALLERAAQQGDEDRRNGGQQEGDSPRVGAEDRGDHRDEAGGEQGTCRPAGLHHRVDEPAALLDRLVLGQARRAR